MRHTNPIACGEGYCGDCEQERNWTEKFEGELCHGESQDGKSVYTGTCIWVGMTEAVLLDENGLEWSVVPDTLEKVE